MDTSLLSNMLGAYGPWAASQVGDEPGRLSFRNSRWTDLATWRKAARTRLKERLLSPYDATVPQVAIQHQWEFDGLEIEHLTWQLPFGPPTQALFLKPAGVKGPLPAVLGLHDHGGNKYFGLRKITQVSDDLHPIMRRHQNQYYGGVAWANELAKQGFAVLVHDVFTFASRRMRAMDVPEVIKQQLNEEDPESEEEIERYNRFAADHEHLIAKSLFCSGTTWPGVFTSDDQWALDYLCRRPEVDRQRIGCCGLSGGGLRAVYLAGIDPRITCTCAVGMMTTWRDYLLHKCYTHTWMIYIPGLPVELDYPEILGLSVPNPVLVLNNREDQLFTLSEMERADRMLSEVYSKADAKNRARTRFFPGPHKFDLTMQKEAFAWFHQWLDV